MKNFKLILIESIIVAVGLIFLFVILQKIFDKKITNNYLLIGLSGSLFHIFCEYSGINIWYSKNYCKLLKE
jgi:hypothetical protein